MSQERPRRERSYAPAKVRFYVDADVLGLAKLLVRVRNDVTYPGDPVGVLYKRERPPCPIASPAVLDPDWIPEVTSQDWLIVTRDANIAVNRAEIAAVRDNNARMVTLASREAKGTWEQPESIRPSGRSQRQQTSKLVSTHLDTLGYPRGPCVAR